MEHYQATILAALVLASPVSGSAAEQRSAVPLDARQPDAPENAARVTGILIGTYQSTSQDRIGGEPVKDEGNGQLFAFGERDMGPGTWSLEVRGSTTPHDGGVTSFYGEVNDAVGETLNSNGKGRLGSTQFFYTLPVAGGDLSVGLLDATALLDANEIADDEYTQFLGTSFVNNPSIQYPSFALGANYQIDFTAYFGYQGSTHET